MYSLNFHIIWIVDIWAKTKYFEIFKTYCVCWNRLPIMHNVQPILNFYFSVHSYRKSCSDNRIYEQFEWHSYLWPAFIRSAATLCVEVSICAVLPTTPQMCAPQCCCYLVVCIKYRCFSAKICLLSKRFGMYWIGKWFSKIRCFVSLVSSLFFFFCFRVWLVTRLDGIVVVLVQAAKVEVQGEFALIYWAAYQLPPAYKQWTLRASGARNHWPWHWGGKYWGKLKDT